LTNSVIEYRDLKFSLNIHINICSVSKLRVTLGGGFSAGQWDNECCFLNKNFYLFIKKFGNVIHTLHFIFHINFSYKNLNKKLNLIQHNIFLMNV